MDAFYGEIRAFPYGFVPQGWLPCDGRTLAQSQFQILFSLIGTLYGKTTQTDFKLPDLRGRAVMGSGTYSGTGQVFQLAHPTGEDIVSLTTSQIPNHDHQLQTQAGTTRVTAPSAAALPTSPLHPQGGTNYTYYAYVPAGNAPASVQMSAYSVAAQGGSMPHDNHSPFLVMWYAINAEAPDSLYPTKD